MRRARYMRSAVAGAAAVGAMLFVAASSSPGARAAADSSPAAASAAASAPANGGVPAAVNPSADLAAQAPTSSNPFYNDSIYAISQLQGGGHKFAVLVDVAALPNVGQYEVLFSISDETTGWYKNYETPVPAGEFAWSTTGLNLMAGSVTMTGSAQQIDATATTPVGSFTGQYTPRGHTFNYSSAGLTQLLSDTTYEFAFPDATTTGTLTAEGSTFSVSGTSWVDRQWGPFPLADPSMQWTWFGMTLSNGDEVAVWDILDGTAQNSWATVQSPSGSYQVVPVTPVANGASNPWTSPTSGNTYPTAWNITIPSLSADLIVTKTGPTGQEFPNPGAHVEATGSVVGIFSGSPVAGSTFLEQNGNWSATGG
jgi:Lipocalin-like domain/CrtC N-terminal lipocalin domain